jgi:hypothetical protein
MWKGPKGFSSLSFLHTRACHEWHGIRRWANGIFGCQARCALKITHPKRLPGNGAKENESFCLAPVYSKGACSKRPLRLDPPCLRALVRGQAIPEFRFARHSAPRPAPADWAFLPGRLDRHHSGGQHVRPTKFFVPLFALRGSKTASSSAFAPPATLKARGANR